MLALSRGCIGYTLKVSEAKIQKQDPTMSLLELPAYSDFPY